MTVLWSRQRYWIICECCRVSSQVICNERFDASGENWHEFLKRFATSVQHVTGKELSIDEASHHVSSQIVEEELEELRNKVEQLSDEVFCFFLKSGKIALILSL